MLEIFNIPPRILRCVKPCTRDGSLLQRTFVLAVHFGLKSTNPCLPSYVCAVRVLISKCTVMNGGPGERMVKTVFTWSLIGKVGVLTGIGVIWSEGTRGLVGFEMVVRRERQVVSGQSHNTLLLRGGDVTENTTK